jgi:gentisate 1,2-dioxygenase
MAQANRMRVREREPGPRDTYEESVRYLLELRERAFKGQVVIKGREVPWEINQQGKMRWYLHPSIEDVCLRTHLLYVQEIPPGSRSGRQRCQGGTIFYVVEGRGYTLLDGAKHTWEAEDVICLPIPEEGVTFQHFNASATERVLMIACEPNLIDALGVDKGSGFEQLENCPEYTAAQCAAR